MIKWFQHWLDEAKFIYEMDPSCHSLAEAFFLFPSIRAMRAHAHAKKHYLKKRYFLSRWLSERAKHRTGIEIHPGATIGRHVFIDHGAGVVIGETAIIGDRVMMYHGVTLGGTGKEKGIKRHPTVEHDVIIGSRATILGNVTIGHHSKIGAGAVVLHDIPPYSTAVGVPARIIPHQPDQVHIF
ncbi:serine O-acetyltransferase EpsC [Vaginisenegalia massiliensis]|uniref:serine O-acetyltransferase EpsC n=1 Tax=Vaginisenegalia massiliensis TaxID=2058294 RepID=UPI000F538DF0|nr:serine O-acetyltransferase EpsC [Vaginisenegalia massiliensis]